MAEREKNGKERERLSTLGVERTRGGKEEEEGEGRERRGGMGESQQCGRVEAHCYTRVSFSP